MLIVALIAITVDHVIILVQYVYNVMIVVMNAMMYIVGVNCLLLITEAAELEMEYNVQIMLNYLKSIHYYKYNIYKSIQHNFQCSHYSCNSYHNLDNILYIYRSWCNLEYMGNYNNLPYKLYNQYSYHNNNQLCMNLRRLCYNFDNFGNYNKAHR